MKIFKRNGNYFFDFSFTINGIKKRYRRQGGKTRKEAEYAASKLKAELEEKRRLLSQGIVPPEKKSNMLFSEFAEKKFLPLDDIKGRREKTKMSHLTSIKHLTRFFGQKYLSQITKEDIDQYIKERKNERVKGSTNRSIARPVSNATINRELTCLNQILRLAMKYGYIQKNPASEIEKLKESPRWTILKDDEARRLIDAASPHLRPILKLLLFTGMRRNEALKLVWAFPDYMRKTYQNEKEACSILDLNQALIYIPKELAKNHKARIVPLSQSLVEMFNEMRNGAKPGSRVFNISDIKRSFKTASKRAGLSNIRIHDLRHTCASRMIEVGINVVDVCELLGHSDLKITMKYCHPSIDNKRQAVERLSMIYDGSRNKVDISAPQPFFNQDVNYCKYWN
jgi:integrase